MRGTDENEFARACGFASALELRRMVFEVDISTPAKLQAFMKWKLEDGSKAGLLRLKETREVEQ